MTKPKLTYFDAPVSRGEECRIALFVAGVDFEDHRIKQADWPALKPTTPMGQLPVLELPGRPPLAQSNAILALIGRQHDLHPADAHEAARHEALMAYVEDARHAIAPSNRMTDLEEKKKARLALAETTLPTWARNVERLIGDGPFLGGARLNVADIKLYLFIRWIKSGTLDHVPATIFDGYPKLNRLFEAVRGDARVQGWLRRQEG